MRDLLRDLQQDLQSHSLARSWENSQETGSDQFVTGCMTRGDKERDVEIPSFLLTRTNSTTGDGLYRGYGMQL